MSVDFKICDACSIYYSGYTYAYDDVYYHNRDGERHMLNAILTSAYGGWHYIWCCLHSCSLFCSAISWT